MKVADTGHSLYGTHMGEQFHVAIGPETVKIIILGKTYFFEWHRMFGPSRVNGRTGDICQHQPSEKSPYWVAVQWWHDQGKRIGDDGLAVWEPEAIDVPILEMFGPRSGFIVGYEKKIPSPFARSVGIRKHEQAHVPD